MPTPRSAPLLSLKVCSAHSCLCTSTCTTDSSCVQMPQACWQILLPQMCKSDPGCHGAAGWSFLNLLGKLGLAKPRQHHSVHRQGLTSGATGLSPPGPTPPRADPPLVLTVMLLRDTPGVPRSPRLGRTTGSAVIGSEWSRALMSAANCQTSSLAWVMDSCRQTGDSAMAL